jgi:F-type H+-transporting ATPase subunit alpha
VPDPRVQEAVRALGEELSRAARGWRWGVLSREEGRVVAAQDGVLRITGLPGAAAEELLEIDERQRALVLGLDPGGLQAVLLGDTHRVSEGARARSADQLATVPVGEALLGRVIDPLGRPLDGRPAPRPTRPAPLERPAPPIHARAAVHRPLYTGTLAVDAMLPIGRGQRELLLGDEGTGKTSLALTAMLRQRQEDIISVYVAIGRRRSETWQVVEALRAGGGRWVVVSAPEDTGAGLRYLAPFAGTAVAEYFMDRGEHALVVYDDLTDHAVAWRELCLLMRRPPGREAFPGDVFYLHARLLERATQLSGERGGGSLTALPLAVTEDGRLSAYIPTNLISITDGQVVLSRALFASGQKPAVDLGLSVSRIGGKAQAQAYRALAGRLKLDYAAFLELESFARIGARLEPAAARRLAAGRRLRLLLRAPRLVPMGVVEQVTRLALAAAPEALLRVPEGEVGPFAEALTRAVVEALPGLAGRLERDAVLSNEESEMLGTLILREVSRRYPEAPDG